MKKLLFLLVFLTPRAWAQPYWIQPAGGAAVDEAMDISADGLGNTYTTGYYSSTGTFGSFTLSNAGITDVFLTKTDNNGQFLWAVKGGGTASDRGLSVKTDAAGNSVITGYYYNTATFGTQNITSAGLQDIFIAKYDNAGNLLWLQTAGGTASDIGNAVTFDNNGNVIVTGEFSGTAQFGTFSLSSMNGSVDVFTAKLDANGNFLWAKKGSAPQIDRGIDVACDASGNVYVTGQFTDTITFDVTHFNNMFNAIFLIKYNSSGTEQWFRVIGGGSQNIANAIAVDGNNNIVLAGDFLGTLTFFSCPSNVTLTNTYPRRIFVASYSPGGNLNWKESDGSNDQVTARNLCISSTNEPCVIGNFKCKFNEYADQYGQGTFNTVGFWDVFVTKYNSAGSWQWSRQLGGKKDDNGNGIALSNNQPVICGSYNGHLGIPLSGGFTGYGYQVSPNVAHSQYCSDPYYGNFGFYNSPGADDVFIGKCIDVNREPYDYYTRTGSGCNRDYVGVCINTGSNAQDNICGPDSVDACQFVYLQANTNTSQVGYNAYGSIGPDFTFLWSNGATTRQLYVSASGYYSVTCTSADGCFVSMDTIYVTIHPNPPQPVISDNVIVNTNAANPDSIILCAPASPWIWGGNYSPGNQVYWTGPNGITPGDSVLATQSGWYCFNVVTPYGCGSMNCVPVEIDSLLVPIIPGMTCLNDPDKNDSITICQNGAFTMLVFDTITNPNANLDCIDYSTIYWSVTPSTINYMASTGCFPYSTNTFVPSQPGWYTITATVVRKTACDTDTVAVTRSIYVDISPLPAASITGNLVICPGDSTQLVVTGGLTYQWTGNSGPFSNNDSIWVSQPGFYTCTVTNSAGCSVMAGVMVIFKPGPVVTMNPTTGLICPNDSVQLSCSGSGTFQWYGPNGPFGGNTSVVYANTPGNYYCVQVDSTGCTLVSNTVTLLQYTTPYLQPTPDNIICPNDSVIVNVVTNPGSSVQWLPPLSGNSLTQTINAPGTYSCTVVSCGITTTVSVTIVLSSPSAQITALDSLSFCMGDSLELSANPGNYIYNWNPYNYSSQNIFVFNTGLYILTVTDPYGCTASDSIVVHAYANNLTAPLAADTFVCKGKNAVLNVSGMPVIEWALAPNGTPFNFGNSYTTPPLNANVTYYLQSHSGGCKSAMAQVNITVDDCPVTIPNVFSPNGDGVNDVFTFNTEGMKSLHCRIYNRWGNLIYEWDDILQGWDGTNMHNGGKVSDGVYYYIADIEDLNGVISRQHGFVQVLQN